MWNSSEVGNWCHLKRRGILESKRPGQWVRGTLSARTRWSGLGDSLLCPDSFGKLINLIILGGVCSERSFGQLTRKPASWEEEYRREAASTPIKESHL